MDKKVFKRKTYWLQKCPLSIQAYIQIQNLKSTDEVFYLCLLFIKVFLEYVITMTQTI